MSDYKDAGIPSHFQEDEMKNQTNAGFAIKAISKALVVSLLLAVTQPAFALATAGASEPETALRDLKACTQPGAAGTAAKMYFSNKYSVPVSKINETLAGIGGTPLKDRSTTRKDHEAICGASFILLPVVFTTFFAPVKSSWGYKLSLVDLCVDHGELCASSPYDDECRNIIRNRYPNKF